MLALKRAIVMDLPDAAPQYIEEQGHPLRAEMYPVLRNMPQSNTPIKANYRPNRRQTSVNRLAEPSVASEAQSGVPELKSRWRLHQSNVDDPVGAQPVHQAGDGRQNGVDCRRRGDVVSPPQHRHYTVGAEVQHLSEPRLVLRRRPHSTSSVKSHVHVSQLKKKKHKLIIS